MQIRSVRNREGKEEEEEEDEEEEEEEDINPLSRNLPARACRIHAVAVGEQRTLSRRLQGDRE